MNLLKNFSAIGMGGLSTGITLAVTFYFLSLYRPTSGGNFISFSNPEYILAVVGVIFGVIIGGILGGFVVGLQLNFLKAAFSGFIFYFLLGVAFVIITGEADRHVWYGFFGFIANGAITGAVLSLIHTDSIN